MTYRIVPQREYVALSGDRELFVRALRQMQAERGCGGCTLRRDPQSDAFLCDGHGRYDTVDIATRANGLRGQGAT